MSRIGTALVLSLVAHAVAVLAVASTLAALSSDAIIVELDPLASAPSAAPRGGPAVESRSTPPPDRPASRPPRARAAAAAAPRASTPGPAVAAVSPPPITTPPVSVPSARIEAPATPSATGAPIADVDLPSPAAGSEVVAAAEAVVPPDAVPAAPSSPIAGIGVAPGRASSPTARDGALAPGAGTEGDSARGARGGPAVASLPPAAVGDGGAGYATYLSLLRRRIQDVLAYPMVARRRGITGTVHVEIAVHPNGAIGNVAVIGSSRHRLLDEAAVDAVRALGRVPFPPGVEPRPLRARLPIVFELR